MNHKLTLNPFLHPTLILGLIFFLVPTLTSAQSNFFYNTLSIVKSFNKSPNTDDVKKRLGIKSFEVESKDASELKITASFFQNKKFEVIIANEDGMVIFQEEFETDILNLSLGFANLPKGNYHSKIITEEGELEQPIL